MRDKLKDYHGEEIPWFEKEIMSHISDFVVDYGEEDCLSSDDSGSEEVFASSGEDDIDFEDDESTSDEDEDGECDE